MQTPMTTSVKPTPHVCTNMSNKLQSSASLKTVVKLHICHLDFFFLNVWMNLACKGLGWTSELHPYSLSLSIQNIVFWKPSLTPQTCPDIKIVINWFIWGRCRHEVFCLFVCLFLLIVNSHVKPNPSYMASRWVWMSDWKYELMTKHEKL